MIAVGMKYYSSGKPSKMLNRYTFEYYGKRESFEADTLVNAKWYARHWFDAKDWEVKYNVLVLVKATIRR